MATNETYRKLLDAAIEFNKTHRINPLEQGNLFTILEKEYKEVSAHSAFLYFVFKPFQTENDRPDDYNLRELLKELLMAKQNNHKNIGDYEYLDIRREVTTEFGRLDFIIDADEETFVIELKIKAKEQPKQIERYIEYLRQQDADEKNIFFLTPAERGATTGEAINITLKDNIYNVMERIKNNRTEHVVYASMIDQYMKVIKNITQGEFYMGETVNAIETAEDLKAVERLIENRNSCMQKIMVEFFNKLGNRLTDQLNIDGCPQALSVYYKHGSESIYNYYSETNRYPALTYEIADHTLKSGCKLKENVKLYFFVEVGFDRLYCGISPRKMPLSGDLEKVECENAVEPYQAFNANSRKVPKTKHEKIFPIWEYLTVSKREIHFSLSALNGTDSILNLLEKNSLSIKENVIEELAIKILNRYKEYCQAIYEIE